MPDPLNPQADPAVEIGRQGTRRRDPEVAGTGFGPKIEKLPEARFGLIGNQTAPTHIARQLSVIPSTSRFAVAANNLLTSMAEMPKVTVRIVEIAEILGLSASEQDRRERGFPCSCRSQRAEPIVGSEGGHGVGEAVAPREALALAEEPEPLAAEKSARATHVDGHLRTIPSSQTPPPPSGDLRNSQVRPI
jgi:hypothetical protein